MPNKDFVHLHHHTDKSLLDGAIQVKPLADRVTELGMKACAMTDHGNIYGAVSFYNEMKKHDVKPIIGCCLPGQLIYTSKGVKPIEQVQAGEQVLTHEGRFQPVVRTMSRHYRGEIYGLKASNSQTVWLTGEHPVLTVGGPGQESRWVRADEIQGGSRDRRRGVASWKTYVALPRLPQAGLKECAELNLCDYLDESIYAAQGDAVHKVSRFNKWDHTIAFDIPARVGITPDLCRLLGLFVAEGSFQRDRHGRATCLTFTFHRDEAELADFVQSALQRTFNLRSRQTVRDSKMIREVHCSNTVIARLFEALCGSGCSGKRIPEFVYYSSRQNISAFVGAVVDGDGRRAPTGQVNIRMTSRDVVYGLRLLAAGLGYAGMAVEGKGSKLPLYLLTWSERPAYRRYIQDEKYLYFPLKSVSTRFYDGPVFNLEVAEDHSYVTDFALHNCEVYLAPSSRFDKKDARKGQKPYNHMILLAKDREGYHNLVRLTSKAFKEGFYRKPRIDRELLSQFGGGLIGLSACLSGVPQQHLKEGKLEAAEKAAYEFQDILGKGNYFLEIQDHELADQRRINKDLIELSKKTGIPLVATNDAHYLFREDYEAHDVMLCIGTGKTVNDTDRMSFGGPQWYVRSPEEMAQIFSYAPDAVTRTLEVAEMCDLKLPLGENRLPVYPIPAEEGDLSIDEYFDKVVRQGYERRRETIWERMRAAGSLKHGFDEYQARVSREIEMIKRMGFPSYFLIVWDFIKFAKDRGIPVGPGRGSAAGSLVAYCLEITDVDPIQYDLLFERFLNPDRVSMPDIDIDFCVHGRGEVINHVSELYGRDSVCQIITFGTMASKAAIKDVGRALDMPYADVEKIAKLIPPPIRGRNVSITQALEMVPELKQAVEKDAQTRKVIEIARRLEGCARHSSVHAAGVVISPQPLEELVPVAVSNKQELTTQFEMSDLEKTGMLKMDFLGLTTLSIINQCCKTIKELTGREINWREITLDDPKTYELFAQGHTEAIFQFESCLSGDTQISKEQTIKDLYEKVRRLKEAGEFATEGRTALRLKSCYVDEGRFHNNAVLDVVATGVRAVYRIVTESNYTIKATAEHHFLTERGWLQLGELDPRTDKLLFKTDGYYGRRVCADCGAPLKSKVLKTLRCKACSARITSNPGKPEARAKISKANTGKRPWNYMADAANPLYASWVSSVKRGHEKYRGKTFEEIFGPERAAELKAKMSARSTGEGNPMYGRTHHGRTAYSAAGFRKDLGHYVRSSWEADFARVLKHLGVEYQYEPRRFTLSRADAPSMTYSPDFFVPESRCFYEIKGWMDHKSAEKIRLFREQYPEETLVVIDKTQFAELQMRYGDLVEWECPKVPESTSFVKIKSITYEGEEETFDIRMRAPGNNFLASGFVVHNSGMQEICRKLKPKSIEDLSALNALYRPGPLDGGMVDDFIDRYHGKKPVEYITEEMEEILQNTYGILVYQEQIMQLAQRLGGYSLGEADLMRRAMGKKKREEMAVHEEKFIAGCVKNKIPKKKAREIFRLMAQFADYGFNRSHSVAYAHVAYQTAYLKANYAEHFYAAVMTYMADDSAKILKYASELRAQKIRMLPPDVNESGPGFTPVEGAIRYGLSAIKGIGQSAVGAIIEARAERPFTSLYDFAERVGEKGAGKRVLESLVCAGAFDSLKPEGESLHAWRACLLATVDKALDRGTRQRRARTSGQADMFGAAAGSGAEEVQHPLADASAWTHKELLDQEKAAIGFYVSGHPLEDFSEKIEQLNCRTVLELSSAEPDTRVRLAGVVSDFTARNTKKGDRYAFFRLEDLTGAGVKCVLWPEALKTKGKDAANDALLLVVGRLDGSGDSSLTVVCDEVTLLEKARIPLRHYAGGAQPGARPNTRALVIELPAEADVPRACEALTRTLQGHPGDCAVFFDLPLSADGFKVRLRPQRPLTVSSDQRLQDELKAAGFAHRWEELGPPSAFRGEPDYFGGAHVSNAIH